MARSGSARSRHCGPGKLRLPGSRPQVSGGTGQDASETGSRPPVSNEPVLRFRSRSKPGPVRTQMMGEAPGMWSNAPQFASPRIQPAGILRPPEWARLMPGNRSGPNAGRAPPAGRGSRGLPGPRTARSVPKAAASRHLRARCGREAKPRRRRAVIRIAKARQGHRTPGISERPPDT